MSDFLDFRQAAQLIDDVERSPVHRLVDGDDFASVQLGAADGKIGCQFLASRILRCFESVQALLHVANGSF